ncbi:type II toxin-antitoxin system RelE/ParE family toxin [Roseateles sp.]|uniref:type II toxin-antitoxin system RelE/ParE family toxin n=1 Tax=Roseateles sp. TaxID=1971397 RepID=UPI0032632FD0
MPYGVAYGPEASDQLEELYRYIAERRSPNIAEHYTSAVIETCEGLALFPLRGVSREDIRPGLRVTHHRGRTVIAYAVDQRSRMVFILGVFYGGQELERAFAEDRDG